MSENDFAGNAVELKASSQPAPPKSPDEAIKAIETHAGFHAELVAAEPMVRSPVAAAFDENGNLYVCEMTNYPSHSTEGKPLGSVRLLRDNGLDIWVYTETAWFVTAQDGPHVAREAWIIKTQPEAAALADADLARAFKIVGVCDDHAKVAAAEAPIQQKLGDTASATRSEPHFLDITHPKATKGFVVHSLSRRLGLPPGQIATIGDMPNDVLMFAESGFSIAMGNASDAVKARASAVTDTNEDDGFAKAVRRFLLQPDAASPLKSWSAP